jgi:hypothetical protein
MGRQALFASDRVSFETHQELIPFLETLSFCGRGRHDDAALLSLKLKNSALTIHPLDGRHDGMPR